MISIPFESKNELEIRTSKACLTGASLPVEVIIRSKEPLNPLEVRLELIGEETYYVERENRLPKGQLILEVVKKLNRFIRLPCIVPEQLSLTPGVEVSCEIEVQVPIDAPPSCFGKVVDMHWILKAVLDMPGYHDQSKELPVQIMSALISTKQEKGNLHLRSSTDGFTQFHQQIQNKDKADTPQMYEVDFSTYRTQEVEEDAERDLRGEKTYRDCILILKTPEGMLSNGAVSGSFQIQVLHEFQVNGIRVELEKLENANVKYTRDIVARQDLCGPTLLNITDSYCFTFSLPLPPDAPPTTVTPHSSLSWQVRAILDRKLRKDYCVERDVIIYNGLPEEEIPSCNS